MTNLESIKIESKLISIRLYNLALTKAKMRNLTDCIELLKLSLKYDKTNIDAYNLLGLAYYAIGEYVEGMCQWIISINFDRENNIANNYLSNIQNDVTTYQNITNNIHNYNDAIKMINNNDISSAINKLENIVKLDPNWIKPRTLLALLLIKTDRVDKLGSVVKSIVKIDKGCEYVSKLSDFLSNRKDLFKEDKIEIKDGIKINKTNNTISYKVGSEEIVEPSGKSKINILNRFTHKWQSYIFISVITFIFIWVFLVPIKVRKETSSNNDTIRQYKNELDSLLDEKKVYEANVKEKELSIAQKEKKQQEDLEKLKKYMSMIESGNYNSDSIIKNLDEIYREDLTDEAKAIYDNIVNSLADSILADNAYRGYNAYSDGDYKTCIKCYEKVMAINETEYEGACMYQLAVSYDKTGNDEKAMEYHTKVVSTFPGTDIAVLSQDYIDKHNAQ